MFISSLQVKFLIKNQFSSIYSEKNARSHECISNTNQARSRCHTTAAHDHYKSILLSRARPTLLYRYALRVKIIRVLPKRRALLLSIKFRELAAAPHRLQYVYMYTRESQFPASAHALAPLAPNLILRRFLSRETTAESEIDSPFCL